MIHFFEEYFFPHLFYFALLLFSCCHLMKYSTSTIQLWKVGWGSCGGIEVPTVLMPSVQFFPRSPMFHFVSMAAILIRRSPFQLVSYHAWWSTGVRVSFKGTRTGPLPLRRATATGCVRWWGSGCEVMEGWRRDEVIKECKVDEGGCDGMAASRSPGQPLNSESTPLIMTCQGCE